MTPVDLHMAAVLAEPYTPITHAYFLHDSMVSLLSLTSDGATMEIAVVGSEGLIGVSGLLEVESMPYRAVVQGAGRASRIDLKKLKELFDEQSSVRRVILRYLHAMMMQTAQSAVCSRFHSVEQRLARWILSSRDRVHKNTLPYTQEFLSHMVGADRASVALAAGALKRAGFINYTRGNITILDSKELEQMACECYHLLKLEFQNLMQLSS